jgi:hypothetical protein
VSDNVEKRFETDIYIMMTKVINFVKSTRGDKNVIKTEVEKILKYESPHN